MKREPSEAGREVLAAAVALCSTMDAAPDRRRELWRRAQDEGCPAEMIATACGVSVQLVRLEVAKARGLPWATGQVPSAP